MTGAVGLIGRPLVTALARDERVAEVVSIDVRAPEFALADGVRAVVRDTRDPRIAADLDGIDALVHLAFRVLDAGAYAANVDGARNAFESALAAGVSTIVYASSGAVYGSAPDNPVPLREDHPLRAVPPFAYPRAKHRVERMLDELEETSAVRVVRIRPTTTLGPGAPLLLAGRVHVGLSDFDPPQQFTWVDDVVAAFVAALREPRAAGPFNVGAPGTVRLSEVPEILGVRALRPPYRLRRGATAGLRWLHVPGTLAPGFVDMARYPIVVDSTRARRELAWSPALDSVAALQRFGETLPGR